MAAANASEVAIGKVLDKARFWVEHGVQPMNDRQRKVVDLLLDKGRGGFEGGMTNGKYVSIAKTSPATAQRDLADLVQKGISELVGAGRSARYEIKWNALTSGRLIRRRSIRARIPLWSLSPSNT